jgi:hypothetical protein
MKKGVHYLKLVSNDLPREKTRDVLSVANKPEILRSLQRNPIESITICRVQERGASAVYDWTERTVTVNSARKLGRYYGADFIPGETRNFSAATKDLTESIKRAFLQELAHHLENTNPGVATAVSEAWADPAKKPIT